jgi:hypothetical protein
MGPISGTKSTTSHRDNTCTPTSLTVRVIRNFCYAIGATTEWVAERPGLGPNTFAELSNYDWDKMTNAYVWTGASKYLEYSQTNAQELWMYNEYYNGDDNNKLSSATNDGAATIYFPWHNFH